MYPFPNCFFRTLRIHTSFFGSFTVNVGICLSSFYAFSRTPKKAIQEAREVIASCIGASPDEIFFTSGGTESDNWAIKGIAMSDEGNHTIITSSFEHHAVLISTCPTA